MYSNTPTLNARGAQMRSQFDAEIDSSKAYSCLQFLQQLEINENVSILELDLHLEALASYSVIDYIQ